MRQDHRRAAAVGLGLLGIVGGGYAAGRLLQTSDCNFVVGLATLAGAVLGLVALFRRPRPERGLTVERPAGGALVAYVILAVATEQFAWVSNPRGVAVATAWLFPLVLGGVVLPRRGGWIAGLGCWAVLFAGTAAMTYTTSHVTTGMGLIMVWWE